MSMSMTSHRTRPNGEPYSVSTVFDIVHSSTRPRFPRGEIPCRADPKSMNSASDARGTYETGVDVQKRKEKEDNGRHSSDIANARRSIHLQLAMALAQEILDGAKVLLIHRAVLLELRSAVRLSSESIDRANGKERLTYRA